MEQAKQVAYGFAAVASAIFLFVTVIWQLDGYLVVWVGAPVFLFLAIPFCIHCVILVNRFNKKQPVQIRVKQAKNVLMALQGFGFACWFFDVLSTIFVININQAGTELNPLGWPYSAPTALAYYVPITFVAYSLLFKIKKPASFYAAVAVSALTLFMGARNLFASLNNFVGISSVSRVNDLEILGVWIAIAIILATINIKAILKAKNKNA
jgi:hypothetical protein